MATEIGGVNALFTSGIHPARRVSFRFASSLGKSSKVSQIDTAARGRTCFDVHSIKIVSEADPPNYRSFAYSALACFRMGMSGSASFQRVRKYWYAVWAFAESPCTAYARARPRRASAPSGKFLTAPQ